MAFGSYSRSHMSHAQNKTSNRPPGKYKHKLQNLKIVIKEMVFENAALVDEISEVQEQTIVRTEERTFLLKKLSQLDPQVDIEIQRAINQHNVSQSTSNGVQSASSASKKGPKKRPISEVSGSSTDRKVTVKTRKTTSKVKKKIVQLIPLDQTGRPIFPIVLGNLTIHSLGEVLFDRVEFHCEDAIYPVGYVSTRLYASVKDPTVKCIYTCKISDYNGLPRFEIAPDNDESLTIVGGTPDVCHSMLLQSINDTLSLNVVSTRPRGNDFFGLTHPTILNLIQSSPGTRKCAIYKWSKFEVSKNGDHYVEDTDTCLNFESLQRSINYCKYKMTSTVLPPNAESILDHKGNFSEYYG